MPCSGSSRGQSPVRCTAKASKSPAAAIFEKSPWRCSGAICRESRQASKRSELFIDILERYIIYIYIRHIYIAVSIKMAGFEQTSPFRAFQACWNSPFLAYP